MSVLQAETTHDDPPSLTMPIPTHQGVLELHPKGYGFLRTPSRNYVPQNSDPYVPGQLINKLKLREGLLLSGPLERTRPGTGPRLHAIDTIEGLAPDKYPRRDFDELTPIDPHD